MVALWSRTRTWLLILTPTAADEQDISRKVSVKYSKYKQVKRKIELSITSLEHSKPCFPLGKRPKCTTGSSLVWPDMWRHPGSTGGHSPGSSPCALPGKTLGNVQVGKWTDLRIH